MKPFIPELTGLRTIAAAMVFFGHVLEPHAEWTPLVVRYGWAGVNIFFALSGYLFTQLYLTPIEEGSFAWRDYLVKRLIRIYPVTTLVLVASIACLGTAYWVDALAHLTLIHGWFPQFRSTINAPMWTLSVEEAFYLLAPVGIFLTAGISRMWSRYASVPRRYPCWQLGGLLVALWILSFALSRGLTLHYLELRLFLVGTWDDGAYTFTFLGRLSDFVAGMMAALAMRHTSAVRTRTTWITLASGLALLVGMMAFIDANGGPIDVARHKLGIVAGHTLALAAALLIIGIQGDTPIRRFLSLRWMVLLGNASFALYLIHFMPVSNTLLLSMGVQQWLEQAGLHPVAASIVNYAALNAVAIAIFLGFEKPTSKWLRKRAFR